MITDLIRLFLSLSVFIFSSSVEAIETDTNNDTRGPTKLILLIADGMGASQIGLLDLAWDYGRTRGHLPDRENAYQQALSKGRTSLISVKPAKYLVADSACASSSISSGTSCLPETIGFNADLEAVEVFSEFAKKNSIKLGLISDTRLTHATPAGFYGRVKSRKEEKILASQFVDSGISLALSGGSDYFTKEQIDSLSRSAYTVVTTVNDLQKANTLPLLGLFNSDSMEDALSEHHDKKHPDLVSMTIKALELLDRDSSFLLMIEAGQIDWASHANDAGLLLYEMLRFEKLLNYLLDFINNRDDVSLIITSDHETAGFSFSYRKKEDTLLEKSPDMLKSYSPAYDFIPDETIDELFRQKKSLHMISENLRLSGNMTIQEENEFFSALGIEKDARLISILKDKNEGMEKFPDCYKESPYYPYKTNTYAYIIGRYLDLKRGIVWSTGTHTSSVVPYIQIGYINRNSKELPKSLSDVGKLLREQFK